MSNAPLPNIPWEDRPAGCADVVWRYSANPIIPRDLRRKLLKAAQLCLQKEEHK